jgi:phosphatidylglycerol---prolipoprotein diacylglyceryl transferase
MQGRVQLTHPARCRIEGQSRSRDLLYPAALPLTAIAFPDIDPVIISLGPLSIHWYGLGYVAGIMFAWWYGKRLIGNMRLWRDNEPPLTALHLDDFVLWAALGVVLGGRLGHILFYDFAKYAADPLSVLYVWQGGMSFHGGLLGTIIAMILFARSRGINVWSMFDTIACAAPVGLGLVRIANFINSELWGRTTDLSWGIIFPNGGPLPRHPSQLYEALLEGLVLFLAMRYLSHSRQKLKTPGFIAGAFAAGYGLCRIAVEFVREPDAQIGYLAGGWLTLGMVLSLPMIAAGVWAMLRAK